MGRSTGWRGLRQHFLQNVKRGESLIKHILIVFKQMYPVFPDKFLLRACLPIFEFSELCVCVCMYVFINNLLFFFFLI